MAKKPNIRFAGFEDDWEQRKLGEMATETYGGGTPKTSNEEFWKGDIPWIQSSDLIDECLFDVRPRKCISQEAVSKSATKLVPQNSIAIVTRVGVGKLAFMPFSYATSQDFLSLSGLKIDPKFTVYALYKMMQSVSNEVQGTSIKGVTKDELLAKKIIFPSCNEQKKIGAYLHNLDHLITLHQRKCDELKKVKKFMLQKMFPKKGEKNPEIRFDGFTNDWEQRKLGATNTFFTDGNYGEAYPKLSDMTDSGSGVPFLTGGNLKDGKLSLDGASYITPEKHSKLTSGHLLEDDIVIAVRGSLGALGYVNTDNSGWNINSQLAILRTDKSELYGKFLIQYLLSWTGQNELLKRQTGSALKQLPIGAIKDVEVPITSIAEQEKIGEYFADLDNLITLHQRKCQELKNVKKYMLQNMFAK